MKTFLFYSLILHGLILLFISYNPKKNNLEKQNSKIRIHINFSKPSSINSVSPAPKPKSHSKLVRNTTSQQLGQEKPAEILSLTKDVQSLNSLPILISESNVKIPYPLKAKKMHIEGNVIIRLTIGKDGEINKAQVISGPEFGLREAALQLVKKLKFLPAKDSLGQNKEENIDHEVIFRIRKK